MAEGWLEETVKLLGFWVFRAVALSSLVMHLVLVIFSESRRREGHGWKRRFLWVAYQVTEWGPMYVLGNLYLDTTPQEKLIVAFWVPFLLQHHARPDNMSAYAMEDHEAWVRRMLLVPVQSFGPSMFCTGTY